MTESSTVGSLRPPTAEAIAAIGQAVLDDLPEEIRALVRPIPIRVDDWPDEATLDELDIDDPLELTGLHRAVPIGERHALDLPPEQPEMILLYRIPILVEWCERGCALEEVVFDVLTHEIAHHLGMDEAAALGLEGRTIDD